MSTIRANTLTDAAGNNSSTAAQIQQGRAKAWFNLNGTGTIAPRDSFNIGSFTDNGTGDYSCTFTATMPNVNYTMEPATSGVGAQCAAMAYTAGPSVTQQDPTTSTARGVWYNTGGFVDAPYALCSFNGD